MLSLAAMLPQVLLVAAAVCLSSASAQWTQAQATWYDGISAGYCGFFDNIPQNQFVAAWPKIEDGPPGSGQEHWQPGLSGDACGQCVEVRCTPGFVENSLGNIFIDRTGDCRDQSLGIVVKLIDECRCSGADLALSDRGNFNWCCNQPTPKLQIARHIDLSRAAFTQLIRDGDYGLGLMSIQFRPASCDYIGLTRIQSDGTSIPLSGGSPISTPQSPPASLQPSSPPSSPPSTTTATSSDASAPSPPSSPPNTPQSPPPASQDSQPSSPPASESTQSGSAQPPPPPPSSPPTPLPSPADTPVPPSDNPAPPADTPAPAQSSAGDTTAGQSSSNDSNTPSSTSSSPNTNSSPQSSPQPQVTASQVPAATQVPAPADVGPETESTTAGELAITLSQYSQCGGTGGSCRSAGGDDPCIDMPFAGHTCEAGLTCVRQNRFYWQCLSQSEVGVIKSQQRPTWQTDKPGTPQGCNKLLGVGEQCGGVGGSCQGGDCVDQQVSGTCCESGSYCKRFDAWYWECRPEGTK